MGLLSGYDTSYGYDEEEKERLERPIRPEGLLSDKQLGLFGDSLVQKQQASTLFGRAMERAPEDTDEDVKAVNDSILKTVNEYSESEDIKNNSCRDCGIYLIYGGLCFDCHNKLTKEL